MKLGMQMFTVRHDFEKDPFGTIDGLADAGYEVIELANFSSEKYPESPCARGDIDSKAFMDKLKERGVKVTGGLVLNKDSEVTEAVDDFWSNMDLMKRLAAYYKSIGSDHMTLAIDYYPTEDYVLRRCEIYNKIGQICKDEGINFLYHNHYHEWQSYPGRDECIYETIMNNTDPDLVGIEFDAYWAFRGGQNYLARMRQFGKRIKMLHVKDFPFEYMRYADSWTLCDPNKIIVAEDYLDIIKPEYFIELGEGMMKMQDIVDLGNELEIPYFLIEQDHTTYESEVASAAHSMRNMKKLRGVE